jgi:hypothetical protein
MQLTITTYSARLQQAQLSYVCSARYVVVENSALPRLQLSGFCSSMRII